ncbi:hypothetical protein Q3C63_11735 [Enterococcus faecium]|nr:hypothetical protein [Enterococcus faecium]
MKFYVIKFGQYFYRKDDQIMNAASLNVTRSLQDSWWFSDYESAKGTLEKFGGEFKECVISGLEDLEEQR